MHVTAMLTWKDSERGNASLMAQAAAQGYFAQDRKEFGDHIRNYYEYMRENDLDMTHTLVNVRRSRSVSATIGTDEVGRRSCR